MSIKRIGAHVDIHLEMSLAVGELQAPSCNSQATRQQAGSSRRASKRIRDVLVSWETSVYMQDDSTLANALRIINIWKVAGI